MRDTSFTVIEKNKETLYDFGNSLSKERQDTFSEEIVAINVLQGYLGLTKGDKDLLASIKDVSEFLEDYVTNVKIH